MKRFAVLLALVAAAAAAESSPLLLATPLPAPPNPCAPVLDFFPTAAEIDAPPRATARTSFLRNGTAVEVPCPAGEDCGFPAVWQAAAQDASLALVPGAYGLQTRGPLKVAFKEYGAGINPRLFFVPSSPLLMRGASVNACTAAAAAGEQQAAAAAAATSSSSFVSVLTRKLMGGSTTSAATTAASAAADADYNVTAPAVWSYTVQHAAEPAVTGELVGKAGQLVIKPTWPSNREDCATIKVTVQGAVLNGDPSLRPFGALSSAYVVCWYRNNAQATAKFVWDTAAACTDSIVAVNVSGVSPAAQNLTQNGSVVPGNEGGAATLFQPAIHVFGALNTTLDGTVLTELLYDQNNQPMNYINKYIMLPPDVAPMDVLTYALDDGRLAEGLLEEGWYRLSAKIALLSRVPGLVDLQGGTAIAQADMYQLAGFSEFAGALVINGSDAPLVPVLKRSSAASISSISSNMVGHQIMEGQNITFTWSFVGAGSQACFHDEEEITSVPCKSPLTLAARPVDGPSMTHLLRVEFRDVCGGVRNASFAYSQAGVTPLSKVEYISVTTDESSVLASRRGGSGGTSGAGRVAARGWAAAAAMGVAALAALLL